MNKTAPKVSVIVPVYNAGERFFKCMDTLVNQSLRELEIILILDCPTDGTDKKAKEYAAKDNRIVIIENKTNLHIGNSRNEGIKVAQGEYIAFSDHDDYRELTMYEELYNCAVKEKSDVVLGTSICTGDQNEVLNFPSNLNHEELRDFAIKNLLAAGDDDNPTPLAAYIHPNLYKTNLIIENNVFFVDTLKATPEDIIFQVQVLFYSQKTSFYSKNLYYHIIHNSSTGSDIYYKLPELRSNGKDILYHFLINNSSYNQFKMFFLEGVKKDFTNNLLEFLVMNKNIKSFLKTRKHFKSYPFTKEAFIKAKYSLGRFRMGGRMLRWILIQWMKI